MNNNDDFVKFLTFFLAGAITVMMIVFIGCGILAFCV